MKVVQKLVLTSFGSLCGVVYAGDTGYEAVKQELTNLKASFDQMTNEVSRVTNELTRTQTTTTQKTVDNAKKSLASIINNMYELVAPLVASQTVYKSISGQNYVIPTSSVTNRQNFDIAGFVDQNKKAMDDLEKKAQKDVSDTESAEKADGANEQ